MKIAHSWLQQVRCFFPKAMSAHLLPALAGGVALLTTGATLPPETPIRATTSQIADITIQVPIVIPGGYPVIVVPRRDREEAREVTINFVAQGDEWATIYLDNRLLFRASNTRRNYSVTLEPGAYYLEITGVSRFEVWGSGYLDVGRDDSNIVVVRYGKNSGVQVAGDPFAWIPD